MSEPVELCRNFVQISVRGWFRRGRVYREVWRCSRPTGHDGPHADQDMAWGEMT